MSKTVKIGVFDSGIGGLSILSEILKKSPHFEAYYISDDEYCPYGNKSDDAIIARSHHITQLLLEKGVSLVVVACNSATAVAVKSLRETFTHIPFVGVEPYLNALNHTDIYPNIKKAGVITTVMTGKSQKFLDLKKLRDPDNRITHIALPNLASCVEELFYFGRNNEIIEKIHREIEELKAYRFTHLILGCTHYPLVSGIIEEYLGLETISPGPNVANRVCDLLALADSERPSESFFFTGTKEFNWQKKDLSFASCE